MTGADYILGTEVLGAVYPVAADISPYFLTELPPDGEQLAKLYAAYLKSFDNLLSSIGSFWHPLSTNATFFALHGARDAITDAWGSGSVLGRIAAVQQLAGLMGWYNANYAQPDGSVDWKSLDTPVNAGIINGAGAVAKNAADAVKNLAGKAEDAAKTAWWTFVIGGAVVVAGGGFLIWKALDSGTARAALERGLSYPLRRY